METRTQISSITKLTREEKNNRIDAICDPNGSTTTERDNIEDCFLNYFKYIFSSQNIQNVSATTKVVKNRLTPDMIRELEAPFTSEEILHAMVSMNGLAAPGPDELPSIFYHTHWDIVVSDITKEVLHVLNH